VRDSNEVGTATEAARMLPAIALINRDAFAADLEKTHQDETWLIAKLNDIEVNIFIVIICHDNSVAKRLLQDLDAPLL